MPPPAPPSQNQQAYQWVNQTRAVPPSQYEDRSAYWDAKRQIAEQEARAQEEERRRQQQQEEEARRLEEALRQQQEFERRRASLTNPGLSEAVGRIAQRDESGNVTGLDPVISGVAQAGLSQQLQYDRASRAATPPNPAAPQTPAVLSQDQQEQVNRFGRLLTPTEEVELGWRAPGRVPGIDKYIPNSFTDIPRALTEIAGAPVDLLTKAINEIPVPSTKAILLAQTTGDIRGLDPRDWEKVKNQDAVTQFIDHSIPYLVGGGPAWLAFLASLPKTAKDSVNAYRSGQMTKGQLAEQLALTIGPIIVGHAAVKYGPAFAKAIDAGIEKSGVRGGPMTFVMERNVTTGEQRYITPFPRGTKIDLPKPEAGWERIVINGEIIGRPDPSGRPIDIGTTFKPELSLTQKIKTAIRERADAKPEWVDVTPPGEGARPAPVTQRHVSGQPDNGTLRNVEMPTAGVPVGEPYSVINLQARRSHPIASRLGAGGAALQSADNLPLPPNASAVAKMKVMVPPEGQLPTPKPLDSWISSSYVPNTVRENPRGATNATFAEFYLGGTPASGRYLDAEGTPRSSTTGEVVPGGPPHHHVWFDVIPSRDEIEVGFQRTGTGAFGKAPGGDLAGLVQMGYFLKDLLDSNPGWRVTAHAYDDELADHYARMAFDVAPDARSKRDLVLNEKRLLRLMGLAVRAQRMAAIKENLMPTFLQDQMAARGIPDYVVSSLVEANQPNPDLINAVADRVDYTMNELTDIADAPMFQMFELAHEAQNIDGKHVVLNDLDNFGFSPEFLKRFAHRPYTRQLATALDNAAARVFEELESMLKGSGLEFQPSIFGGFSMLQDAFGINYGYAHSYDANPHDVGTAHQDARNPQVIARAKQLFGKRNIQVSLFETIDYHAEDLATDDIDAFIETVTNWVGRTLIHEGAHSANPPGMIEEDVPDHKDPGKLSWKATDKKLADRFKKGTRARKELADLIRPAMAAALRSQRFWEDYKFYKQWGAALDAEHAGMVDYSDAYSSRQRRVLPGVPDDVSMEQGARSLGDQGNLGADAGGGAGLQGGLSAGVGGAGAQEAAPPAVASPGAGDDAAIVGRILARRVDSLPVPPFKTGTYHGTRIVAATVLNPDTEGSLSGYIAPEGRYIYVHGLMEHEDIIESLVTRSTPEFGDPQEDNGWVRFARVDNYKAAPLSFQAVLPADLQAAAQNFISDKADPQQTVSFDLEFPAANGVEHGYARLVDLARGNFTKEAKASLSPRMSRNPQKSIPARRPTGAKARILDAIERGEINNTMNYKEAAAKLGVGYPSVAAVLRPIWGDRRHMVPHGGGGWKARQQRIGEESNQKIRRGLEEGVITPEMTHGEMAAKLGMQPRQVAYRWRQMFGGRNSGIFRPQILQALADGKINDKQTYTEIAKQLNVPYSTVASALAPIWGNRSFMGGQAPRTPESQQVSRGFIPRPPLGPEPSRDLRVLGDRSSLAPKMARQPGPPNPVDTLLDAKTMEDDPQASWLRGVRDSIASAREHFSPSERAARALDKSVLDKAKNIVVKYAGQIHQSIPREAGIEARQLRKEMGEATRDQLRSITGALDDFDEATRARFLANLTPEQQATYSTLRQRIDALGDLLVARGILDQESRVENYFTHILDFVSEGQGRNLTGGGGLRTPLKKQKNAIVTGRRSNQTVVDDIVKGYKPVTLDPFKIYEQFVVEAKTRMAMADIIDDIRVFDPDGIQYLKPGQTPPEDFQTVRHPMFEGLVAVNVQGQPRIIRYRWAVRDNVAKYVKALTEPSALRGNPVGSALLTSTSSLKRTVLGGPLDINFAGFMIKAASYAIGSDIRKVLPMAFHAAVKSQDAFDTMLTQGVTYAGRSMTRADMYRRLDEAGLTGGSYLTEISRMMGSEPTKTLLGMIPFLGKIYEAGQGWSESRQFDRFLPTLKHETAAELIAHKLRGRTVTEAELLAIEREAATDINTAMGGLNRVAQGRSKTAQDVMALLAIAPDWLESRLHLYGRAFMPGSQNATSRRFMARALTAGALATVVGSAAYANERGWDQEQTEKYIAENLNPIKMVDGKPRINGHFMEYQMSGSGQWTSLLSWEKDGWKLLFGAYSLAVGDREGFDLTAGGYLSSRLGVGPRLAEDAIFKKNFSGQPITSKKGWPGFVEWLEYEATQSAVPSFASGFLQAGVPGYPGGKQSITGAIQNSSGFGRARSISPSDTIDRTVQDEHIQKSDGSGEYLHYRDLPNDIKGEFDKRHAAEAAAVKEARAQRGKDTFDKNNAETKAGLEAFAPLSETDKESYRLQVSDFIAKQGAIMQHDIEKLKAEGVSFSERSGDLGLIDRYFSAVTQATDPVTKVTDFDKRDVLDETFRGTLNDTEKKRLDEMLSYSADPAYAELKKDKKALSDGGYYDRISNAFEQWRTGLIDATQQSDPAIAQAAQGWTKPDDLTEYIKGQLRAQGIPDIYWDKNPLSNAWDKFNTGINGQWLNEHSEMDILAIKWGYQHRPHSQEAADSLKR